MNQLIILDRDGVINQDSDAYVKSIDEWIPIPGSAKAIADLCKAGFKVAVATNQSGLARKYFSQADLDAMHEKMTILVEAEGGQFAHIAWCPHGPDDHCDCRKPLPGLIHQIEKALNVSAKGAWMVGDSLRDLQAGAAANCNVALVKTGKGEQTLSKLLADQELAGSKVFNDLSEFAQFLLSQNTA